MGALTCIRRRSPVLVHIVFTLALGLVNVFLYLAITLHTPEELLSVSNTIHTPDVLINVSSTLHTPECLDFLYSQDNNNTYVRTDLAHHSRIENEYNSSNLDPWKSLSTTHAESSMERWKRYLDKEQYNCSHVLFTNKTSAQFVDILTSVNPEVNGYLMTITKWGRLCNNMFQYASLVGLSQSTGHRPILTKHFTDLVSVFPNLSIADASPKLNVIKFRQFAENRTNFNETFMCLLRNCAGQHVYLYGFFFSHIYFDHVEDLIRKEFTFRVDIQDKVSEFLASNVYISGRDNHTITVGIHIRLTDKESTRVTISVDYFLSAMRYFRCRFRADNILFVMVSDDQEWVTKNLLPHVTKYQVVQSLNNSGPVDLAIMASCDHAIISIGTYSWWSGWLNHGITTYYAALPRPGFEQNHMPYDTYIPPPKSNFNDWIPIGY